MLDRGTMLLALVMGAGKTVVSLAAIEALHDEGDVERCLVVVPASLKYQWLREVAKFTDARAIIISGDAATRAKQWRQSTNYRYVIVNPESLINDQRKIGHFDAIILDEASYYKNRTVKRTKMIKRIGKTIPFRFALTGQPIENRPEELFSIMEFVDKSVLGDFKTFDEAFIVRNSWGKPLRYRNLNVLFKAMRECMIRKTQEDIADQLPQIIRTTIPVAFDAKGAATYRRISADLLNQITQAIKKGGGFNLWAHYNGGDDNEAQGQIMARLTVLRMLCDNPALVTQSAADFDDDDVAAGSQYAHDIVQAGWMNGLTAAPKLQACIEFIEEALEENPNTKIVLFSFFKRNLEMIKKAVAPVTDSVLFMGGMTDKARDEAKQKFANDPKCRLFLSSDAGGYGVDLPFANVLISYDLPWSSGKLEQREARIIRLSSIWPHVQLVTFVMAGSIEERQQAMLQEKKSINEAWIDGKHHDKENSVTLSAETLTQFLGESTV